MFGSIESLTLTLTLHRQIDNETVRQIQRFMFHACIHAFTHE